jgi:MoaA/NifB/PqqE/SkfB family radical SAM enzyme
MNTISPDLKIEAGIMPFVTFPLTKKCNFKCQYCGHGGELSASMVEKQDINTIYKKIIEAHKLGVRKFRFTGGEPFLYEGIDNLLNLMNKLGVYTLVNTNASLVRANKNLIDSLQDNIHFAVSLDSLNPKRFSEITNTNNMFEKVIDGIEILSKSNRLLRLNMVVTTINSDEILEIIEYCRKLNCNLKLLDVVSVPLPYGDRDDLHYPFIELEEKFLNQCDSIKEHQYARGFGTPCKIYSFSNVDVTVKSTWNGSHYDIDGICNGCEFFPCHEGLYDVFSLPDDRIVGCRWSESSVVRNNSNFLSNLEEISAIFQRSDYCKRESNFAMKPEPPFVLDSLKKVKSNE